LVDNFKVLTGLEALAPRSQNQTTQMFAYASKEHRSSSSASAVLTTQQETEKMEMSNIRIALIGAGASRRARITVRRKRLAW
jgi:hypothetical protein